jgi:hypothetical protein
LQTAFAAKEFNGDEQSAKEGYQGKDQECGHGESPSLDRIVGNNHIAKANAPKTKKAGTRGGTSFRLGSFPLHWDGEFLCAAISCLADGDFTVGAVKRVRGSPYSFPSS